MMKIIKIDSKNPDLKIIKKAVDIIKAGGIVVYPTDTCYGIGASALDEEAIQSVHNIKGRKSFNKPLSVIVKNIRVAKSIAEISREQEKHLFQKLPGRYTLIFKKKKIIPDILTAGLDTIGIRIPSNLITHEISEELLIPYITTSANTMGDLPCYSISDFLKQIKNNKVLPDFILNAGKLPKNKVSTVIDLSKTGLKVLRK